MPTRPAPTRHSRGIVSHGPSELKSYLDWKVKMVRPTTTNCACQIEAMAGDDAHAGDEQGLEHDLLVVEGHGRADAERLERGERGEGEQTSGMLVAEAWVG